MGRRRPRSHLTGDITTHLTREQQSLQGDRMTDKANTKRYGRRSSAALSTVGFMRLLAGAVFCVLLCLSAQHGYYAYGSQRSAAAQDTESSGEHDLAQGMESSGNQNPPVAGDLPESPAKESDLPESPAVAGDPAKAPEVAGADVSKKKDNSEQKHVLVLFSYTPSWSGESDIYEGLKNKMRSSVRMDLVFMDTKNLDKDVSELITAEHVDHLTQREHYDAIIAVDDDALDFVLRYRDEKFKGIPVIFNNINSRERAEQTAVDPLITGISENFFGKETIEAARRLYPKAKRVVGISDHSLTGLGMTDAFLAVEKDFPDMELETLDMMELTRSEIIDTFSSYSDDTILLYLNFTQDKDGNIYGMEESYHFLTDYTDLPLFKPDEGGIGIGVLGGCGGSYVTAGERTAEIVMDVLDGADMSSMAVEEMDGCYLFDASLLKKYGISKSSLPAGTRYVNEEKSLWDKYSLILRPIIVVMIFLITVLALLIADRRRLGSLIKSQKRLSDAELKRRKAESQSSAITQFLSSVSHDIRTPLVSIIGYTDLALSEEDESKKDEYLEKIRSSGMLLTGLVNDTLDVSRSISGKSRINLSQTTMGKVTESVIASISEIARRKRVRFSSTIEGSSLLIRVDQMKLQKIILNLLTNAVKFTPAGGEVRLEIIHLKERVDGCNFRIRVIDTGVGISPDFQKIMYEPFVQENPDPLHMGTQTGTGLGLTIVRNNVEQMGGYIEIDSKQGKGTTVTALLPVDVLGSAPAVENDTKRTDYERLRGMRVLVVEDSDMNTEVVKTILSRKGVETVCVKDGQEAVDEFLKSQPGSFDAILMDLRMPKMNGYEACQIIRSMDREDAGTIPIYALSADVYAEDIRRAMDAGMTSHIAKPLRPETLYDALLGLK